MVQFRKQFAAILVAAAFATTGSQALAADWTVSRSSGDVRIVHDGATPVSLSADTQIRAGDRIVTGATGRIMLVRGAESIIISPGTELIVPAFNSNNGRTTLLQSSGHAEFEVEKRNVQHFEVETPYLAAVVKGTRFVVDVDGKGARVTVERGVVEVFDFDTGQFGLIKAGQQAATVSAAGAGLQFTGNGAFDAVKTRAPRKSLLEATAPTQRDNAAGQGRAAAAKATTALRQAARAEALPEQASRRAVISVGRTIKIGQPVGERVINIKAASKGLASSKLERKAASNAKKSASGDNDSGSENNSRLALTLQKSTKSDSDEKDQGTGLTLGLVVNAKNNSSGSNGKGSGLALGIALGNAGSNSDSNGANSGSASVSGGGGGGAAAAAVALVSKLKKKGKRNHD